MELQYTTYTALLLFTTCLNIFLAWNIWKRQKISGSIYLFFIILAAALWSFTGAMELASTTIASKILWGKISYIAITTVAPLWFLFTVTYSKNQSKVKRQHTILLLIIPALTTLLAFTNELHGLVWPGFSYLETSAGLIILYKHVDISVPGKPEIITPSRDPMFIPSSRALVVVTPFKIPFLRPNSILLRSFAR